jgi:1-deoxy-D-xylulose-5-phosphate reductoisomerase
MMNKGLELIEAHHLFGLPSDRIDIMVHPQSVVHSMVEFIDGSVLAQMGSPDMRIPIAHTLAYPERVESGAERLNLVRVGQLAFEEPDEERFPALRLARQALEAGGSAPIVLNAANEVAVAAFLANRIRFGDIAAMAEDALAARPNEIPATIDDVVAIDVLARRHAQSNLQGAAA